MNKYNLTNKAIDDLSKIWDYTYEVWSENQADKYYYELLSACQEIAENHNIGRNYIEINKEIYGIKSGQHIIFYRVLKNNEIEITRILHSRMDIKNRFEE